MKTLNIAKINLEKLSTQLWDYEKQWIAISEENSIVGSGNTYDEALQNAKEEGFQNVLMFKVPPLNSSFAL
jgi:Family of unknown function (DUF5678)